MDKQQLKYDLSLAYAKQVLSEHREEQDTIKEMCDLLVSAFWEAQYYLSTEPSLCDK